MAVEGKISSRKKWSTTKTLLRRMEKPREGVPILATGKSLLNFENEVPRNKSYVVKI